MTRNDQERNIPMVSLGTEDDQPPPLPEEGCIADEQDAILYKKASESDLMMV